MKRRILALALAVCAALSLLTLPAGAAAADQDTGVVQTIRALGIMVGDSSGNLNLSANVTRAQFAKMLVAASSYRDSAGDGTGASLFKDVKSGYWASQYIKLAVEEGWMIGYVDGSFRPEKSITLEEACTCALRLLGYDSSSLAGSFPSAQLSKAAALELRDQISLTQGGIMTRSDCANLFYNLMTAQTGDGKTYAVTLGYTVTNGTVDYSSLVEGSLSGPYVYSGTLSLPFSVSSATVYRDGAASALSAMSRYDVYYYSENLHTVWVYTKRAAGTITAISPDTTTPTSVTIGGNTYTIGTASAAYQLSAMGGFPVGSTAVLLLGMNDAVADVISGTDSSTVYYGMVTGSEKTASGSGDASIQVNVTVACTDGVVRTFAASSGEYAAGAIVSANITGEGASVTILQAKGIYGTVDAAATKLGSTSFADDIEILDTTPDGEYLRIYPSRLAGVSLPMSSVRYYVLNENKQISRLILQNATGDLWSYGFLADVNVSGSEKSYTYLLNGTQKTLSTSTLYSVSKGGVAIQFSADGSINAMKNLSATSITELSPLYAMNGNEKYLLDDSAQVYLLKNGGYFATALSSVNTASYTLTGWYDSFGCAAGGRIRVIVAQPK